MMDFDSLADRVMVLRDEVLATAEVGDAAPPGTEIFDAVVRAIQAQEETAPGIDLALRDAVARRLAWGEREDGVLRDADQVCQRLISAAQRGFRDPEAEMFVVEVATEVACAVARAIAQAAVTRAGRERAAALREELSQRRLAEALKRQKAELARLEALLGQDG